MANNSIAIAKMLNSSKSVTDKLNSIWEQYLWTDRIDDELNSSNDEVAMADHESEISDSDDEKDKVDMKKNDFELAIEHAQVTPEIVTDENEELGQAEAFR